MKTKTMRDCVIYDMDGTLADVTDIRHFVTGGNTDYHSFHMGSIDVPAHEHVVDMLRQDQADGKAIVIVTARNSAYMYVTIFWLFFAGIEYDEIYMRDSKDQRPDWEVKADILVQMRKDGFNPVRAVDDNPSVVELWEREGIPVTVIPGWVD